MEQRGKKKILYVITKSNWGGAQRYVYDMATSLPKDAFDVAVAAGGDGPLLQKLSQAGIRTISLPAVKNEASFSALYRAYRALKETIASEKPDIVHLNSSLASMAGSAAGRICKVPLVIFTSHGWAFNSGFGALKRFGARMLHWITILLSDKTIAVSEAVKEQMMSMPFAAKKMRIVRLGIATPDLVSREEARRLLHIPEQAFAIGTIAELHPVKGLSYALEAVKSLPFEASYLIIGAGDEEKKLLDMIDRDESLKRRVRLAGFVPQAADLLKAFDIFLLPSISEALGYVIIEAAHAGVPAIASRVGGIPEVIADRETGLLVPPKNPSLMREAIEECYFNADFRTLCARAAKEKAEREFSLGRMVEETMQTYQGEA